jgi:hypothetical protein
MKTKNVILDVDFIGEQTPLTLEDEKALSAFFRLKKENNLKQKPSFYKSTKKSKNTV